MTRRLISSGSPFEAEIGYSRAVIEGDWVFVSGTTGFDYASMRIADDVVAQTEQCLRNIDAALQQTGASFADIVRVRYLLPVAADFEATQESVRQRARPAPPSAAQTPHRCCAAGSARCGRRRR